MSGSSDIQQNDTGDENQAIIDVPRAKPLGGGRGPAENILGQTPEYSGWDVYNNEAIKVDVELVKDWTASLNFLLVFAAIFSAILTALIVESKKLLEVDPSEATVNVLTFIANGLANGTYKPYEPKTFQPSPSDVTINCLFFLSLGLSLFAALASVVALQWVGDYDAAVTRGGSSTQDRAKRRQFRYSNVVKWKMNGIIAALPLLLHFSVGTFLSGLALWIWSINWIVGVVTVGAAAITGLFYGTFTLLAVVSASAPFQTPLSRGIYSAYHLAFAAVYWFAKRMGFTMPEWLKSRYTSYRISNKRDDLAIEEQSELGRDALLWLANKLSVFQGPGTRILLVLNELVSPKMEQIPASLQLNVAQESYQLLVQLVEPLLGIQIKKLASSERTQALWYSILDMLGRNYLSTTRIDNLTAIDKRRMETLQQCYAIPAIRTLTAPAEHTNYILDTTKRDYWSQYCGTADDSISIWDVSSRPNHLFLLLRDIPIVKEPTAEEIEIAIRVSHWRNTKSKPRQVWDDIFTLVEALPATSTFFGSSIVTFAQFCQASTEGVWNDEHTGLYTGPLGKFIQLAANRPGFPQAAIMPMVIAYESLLIGIQKGASTGSVLTNPLFYGKTIQEHSASGLPVHESIILLLSRQINWTDSATERIRRAREVISLLWLRPSHPSTRDWDHLMAHSTRTIPLDDILVMDWIKEADRIPHIVEILQNLATAQAEDASIGPLWRATVLGHHNDPHFLEALHTFDNLTGPDCTPTDHSRMIDWVCQDLEMGEAPDFGDYFTTERTHSLTQLRDPCLRTLADCARGTEFIGKVDYPSGSYDRWQNSWDRIEQYLLRTYPASQSPTILQLQAKLWPMFSFQRNVYREALKDPATLAHLQRVFQYPVHCNRCMDGPGHLLFHLLDTADGCELVPALIPFIETPLDGRTMEIAPIVFSLWYANLPIPLQPLFGATACLQQLGEMLDYVKSSEYHLFNLILNIARSFERKKVFTEDLAAILAGVHYALRLPPQSGSRILAYPLCFSISRILEATHIEESRPFEERRQASREAYITINLLRSSVVPRIVFGRRNNSILSCARAIGGIQPATGWLAPYQE